MGTCQREPRAEREMARVRNRRVFQRADCSIQVVVHVGGRFLYGEVLDLSLGGVKLALQGHLDASRVELTPQKPLPGEMAVIPLAYDVCWQEKGKKTVVGLQFAGGTDAFFRGWMVDHLNPLLTSGSLLEKRKLVRVPCQLEGQMRHDEGDCPCAVMDLSLGGMSLVTPVELYPGETISVTLDESPRLGEVELILLRVQPLTNHYLCGGKFLEPTSDQKDVLSEMVDGLTNSARAATLESN